MPARQIETMFLALAPDEVVAQLAANRSYLAAWYAQAPAPAPRKARS